MIYVVCLIPSHCLLINVAFCHADGMGLTNSPSVCRRLANVCGKLEFLKAGSMMWRDGGDGRELAS